MNYYDEIKKELINNEITKRVKDYSKNKSDLNTYYNVGKMLSEAGKHYGEGIIKEYSKKLTHELGKGYGITNLKRFRQFYILIEKGATLSHQLMWSHYSELIPLFDIDVINYYILIVQSYNLSVRQLREKVRNNEYERLDEKTKLKLIEQKCTNVYDFVKNPILIKNSCNYKEISEKVLKKLILEDIDNFLQELGSGFCYIASEYKIKIGNNYNYIDLLLFNIEFNCYVVVKLKTTELKKEHIGQIEIYMNCIDKNLKKINQDRTIGIIVCKKNNKFIIEYSSDKRILACEYQLSY